MGTGTASTLDPCGLWPLPIRCAAVVLDAFGTSFTADEDALRAIERQVSLAGLVPGEFRPATNSVQDAFNFIGIRLFERFTAFAKTLAPDFHDANLVSMDGSGGRASAKLAAAQETSPPIQIHVIPVFR